MPLSDYDYSLLEDLIAQEPLEDRTSSRMLYLHRDSGDLEDRRFAEILELFQPSDLLVLNDTRVTAFRLFGKKESGGAVEALLVEDLGHGLYKALVKPAKRVREGMQLKFADELVARVESVFDESHRILRFDESENLEGRLKSAGSVPLPPYIHKRLDDDERYQTVVAKNGGSAAAPTAALHFDLPLLTALRSKGVEFATVTLDVGIDTFRPVQAEDLSEHKMHGEKCVVSPETAHKVNDCRGRVIAVGTTTVRTLETFAAEDGSLLAGSQVSKLFIQPGYRFKIVDGMLTNFHLPKTTMLMMISAMSGRNQILRAYEHAIREKYRFLSFGDSMLIL